MSIVLLGDPSRIKDRIQRELAVTSTAAKMSLKDYEKLVTNVEEFFRHQHPGFPPSDQMSDQDQARLNALTDPVVKRRFCDRLGIKPAAVTTVFIVGNGGDYGVSGSRDAFPNATIERLRE